MKKIFISYDYDNDKHFKNLLKAWDKNKDFDFDFNDISADISIESEDAAVIKRAISAKINQSDVFLCLIGEKTKSCFWVKWEIKKAHELGENVVAVKIDKSFESPEEIKNIKAKWAMDFNFKSINNAINSCDETSLLISKGGGEDTTSVNPPSPWSI